MKRKGFTLIELLAVIVILVIIAVIAVPIVTNLIDDSKLKASIQSANNILEAANYYYHGKLLTGNMEDTKFKCSADGCFKCTNNQCTEVEENVKLDIKGQIPTNGIISISGDGKIEIKEALIYGDIYVGHDSNGKIKASKDENELLTQSTPNSQKVYCLVTNFESITEGSYVIVGVNGSYILALSNTINSSRVLGEVVVINNNCITDPAISAVWQLQTTEKRNRYALYNQDVEKYVSITSNATSSLALTDDIQYYFDVSDASDDKGPNTIYLKTTAVGERNLSIYKNDFRAYSNTSAKPLYLYRLR